MKTALLFILIFAVGSYAGMIDYVDDDPVQYLEFSDCDTSLVAGMIVGIMVNPDSGFGEAEYALTDTCFFIELGYNRPLYDSRGRTIAGEYHGEYWFYQVAILRSGELIAPADTTHVISDYIVNGCGFFHVD